MQAVVQERLAAVTSATFVPGRSFRIARSFSRGRPGIQ
jgi:hypothetical protein